MMPESILVFHQGALGDWVLSIPAFRSIRKHHPNEITKMAINPSLLPLLKCLEHSYEGISTDDGSILDLWRENERLPIRIGTLRTAYVFGKKRDPVLFENLGGICDQEPQFLRTFPESHIRVHVEEFQGKALNALDVRTAGPTSRLDPPGEALQNAWSLLYQFGIGEPPIAVHPGSGSRGKNWSAKNFRKLIDFLAKDRALPVIVLLGPADEQLAPEMRGLHCFRGLPLDELAALLKVSRGYLGNDSGVTHLAAATGTRTIALFGPTDPRVWAPRGDHVHVLRNGPEMEDLTYEDVRMRAEAFFFDRPTR